MTNCCSPWFLCSVNHSNISWSSSGYFGVKWPIVVRFAYTFSSPLKSLAWSLRRTMDSISPYSQAISQLFSTASASATTLSEKAILYDKWRVFGMMNIVRNRLIIDFGKQLFVARSHSIDQLGSISIHDRTGWLNVNNKQIAFLKDVIFCFTLHVYSFDTITFDMFHEWSTFLNDWVDTQLNFFVKLKSRLMVGTFPIFFSKAYAHYQVS